MDAAVAETLTRKLLEEWYADRGKKAPRLKPEEELVMGRRLLETYMERHAIPAPLEFCSICKVRARGEHRLATGEAL
jgi:hypothetical protein